MIKQAENALYHILASSPQVAIRTGFRIYAVAVPNGVDFPFVVYKRANVSREQSLGGPMFVPEVSIQVASWAVTYDDARVLADYVRLALDGTIGSYAGVTIQDIRLISETDDFLDPMAVGAQLPPAYETRQLYQIRYNESSS